MRLHLPSPLLRYVLAGLFIGTFPAASGADYTVNNTQSTMPGSNLYGTLEELRASGLLRANDTVVLHNDDSTLTGGLNLLINVQSDNTAAARTLDLAGLGTTPMFFLKKGDHGADMNSIIWENAGNRVLRVEGFGSNATLNLTGAVTLIPPLRAAARLPFRVKVSLQSRWMTMPFSSEITRLPQAERLEEAQFWRSPTMPGSLWATAPFSMPTMFWRQTKQAAGVAQCLPRAVPPPLK